MVSLVELEYENDGVSVVTLNRPEAANALSVELLQQLRGILYGLENHTDIRTVIITGAGKAFCAGADLKERARMDEREVLTTLKLIGDTISAVENLPVPVIAAINGSAFGGGLELALACDIRIASLTAKMGLTETSLGIIPGGGGTQRLPRLAGTAIAKELIYTARHIDAQKAKSLSIVSHLAEPSELLDKARELAQEIAANAPLALRAAKASINQGMQGDLKLGLKVEWDCYQRTLHTQDRLEGLSAFKEKRKPEFTGN